MTEITEKRILFIVAAIFALFLLARGLEDVLKNQFFDYHAYFKGGLALRNHLPIYQDQQEPVFKYPPFFALLILPLTFLGEQLSYLVWVVLMIVQLFFIIHWSRQILDKNPALDNPSSLWLYVLSILPVITHVAFNMDRGQANIFTLFWMTWAWIWLDRDHPATAGFCLAFAMLAKSVAILFLPYLLWRRRFRCLFWCFLFLACFCLLPWAIQGVDEGLLSIREWVHTSLSRHESAFFAEPKNQSLPGALYRLFCKRPDPFSVDKGFVGSLVIPIGVLNLLQLAASVFLYLPLLSMPRKELGNRPHELKVQGVDFALLIAVATILFPFAWRYYFVSLLLPSMLVVLYLFRVKWKDKFVIIAFTLSIVLTVLFPNAPNRVIRLNSFAYSTMTWGTLILIAALWKIKRRPQQLSNLP